MKIGKIHAQVKGYVYQTLRPSLWDLLLCGGLPVKFGQYSRSAAAVSGIQAPSLLQIDVKKHLCLWTCDVDFGSF